MHDYYVSATVRQADAPIGNAFHLWTVRVQAKCLSDARAHALFLIERMNCIYGELQVMWDEAPAIIAPEWNQTRCP